VKKSNIILSTITAVAIGFVAVPASANMDKNTAESRAVIKQFFGKLKGELVAAIKSGGAPHAVSVCNSKAPEIAGDMSKAKGWSIGRTSLKLRNPANRPDAWEKKVLEDFEARKAKGEKPMGMEFAEIVDDGGKKQFRYMSAIPTAEKPCLACHGAKIPAAVEEALKADYPNDKARGYKAGDIRGAFTISIPVK
jgi:hypothetical protein